MKLDSDEAFKKELIGVLTRIAVALETRREPQAHPGKTEKIPPLSYLETAKYVTGIKDDRSARSKFDKFLAYLNQPDSPYAEFVKPDDTNKVHSEFNWLTCNFFKRIFPDYQTRTRSQAQSKNKKK